MIRSPCPALFGIVFPIHWLWGVFSDQACIFTGCFCCGLQRVYLNKVSLPAIKHLGGRDSPPRLPGEREGLGHNQLNKKPSGERRPAGAGCRSPSDFLGFGFFGEAGRRRGGGGGLKAKIARRASRVTEKALQPLPRGRGRSGGSRAPRGPRRPLPVLGA